MSLCEDWVNADAHLDRLYFYLNYERKYLLVRARSLEVPFFVSENPQQIKMETRVASLSETFRSSTLRECHISIRWNARQEFESWLGE